MRHNKSAFLVGALALAAPTLAHAESTPTPTWTTTSPTSTPTSTSTSTSTSTPTSTSERFEVPPPHEETGPEPEAPNPPRRDPMTLPVVMDSPVGAHDASHPEEDKASMFSTEKTRFGINGGIGFPRPVGVGAFLQWDKHWSLGADYSLLPTTKIADVNLDFWAATAGARLYPFHGAFYVGLKSGYQHLSASGYITQSGTTALAQGSIDTFLVNPEIGFMFTWDSGLALGFGAGIQIPLYSNATTTSNLPVAADVLGAVGKIGTSSVPTVDLLRVGFVL
jgi:hypothetical protein